MSRSFWMYGLIPEAMGMSFANILLPIYLVSRLGGSLLDVGLLAGVSGFSLIPSLILWGYLADRFCKCKVFMVFSFAGVGVSLLLIPFARGMWDILALVILKSVSYSASLPTRNILIVESESRKGWENGIARSEFLTGIGEAIGIALGSVTVSLLKFETLFTLCGFLAITSTFVLAILVADPVIMIERRLMSLERFTNALSRASSLISRADSFTFTNLKSLGNISNIFKPSIKLFLIGIFGFSLAGNALFAILPIYFTQLYPPLVFPLFFVNSMANTLSYTFVGRNIKVGSKTLVFASASRAAIIPILALPGIIAASNGFLLVGVILALLGVIWTLFDVSSTCLYMEVSRLGQSGFYSAAIGLGSAIGGYLGGFISMFYGYKALFLVCGFLYGLVLLTFAAQLKKWSHQ